MKSASAEQIDFNAIAGGRHADPFSILGPHVVDDAVVIRAVVPHARTIHIVGHGDTRQVFSRGAYRDSQRFRITASS